MGDVADNLRISEPAEWFVVFHRTTTLRWLPWIAPGPFKHVSAFGYCPGFKAWLVYDVTWPGTRHRLIEDSQAGRDAINLMTQGCDLIKIGHTGAMPLMSSRIGFYCVSSIKHLLGLRCVAVTPTQLHHFLLHHGGTLISERA